MLGLQTKAVVVGVRRAGLALGTLDPIRRVQLRTFAEYALTRHNSKAMTVNMGMECGDVVACPFTCTPGALV